MKYFHALVHKDPDSAFGVEFPDLPGCFSAADRMEDILPKACEALELWFEDEAQAEPRPLEVVQAMVAGQLAEGAFLIAVPYFTSSGKPARVNISIDGGILAAIDTAAAARKLTRSAFLAEAARNEIEGRH
jgi:predicted RNase H-like HicB family nuclease